MIIVNPFYVYFTKDAETDDISVLSNMETNPLRCTPHNISEHAANGTMTAPWII